MRTQFQTLCRGLGLDPDDPNVLDTLRNPDKVPWQSITELIDTDSLGYGGQLGTFLGCLSEDWIITSPGPMARQRSGALASSLKAHGVKGVIVGEVVEEWYLYSFTHPIHSQDDVLRNVNRYLPSDISEKLIERISTWDDNGYDPKTLFGIVLSTGRINLPARIFARDMIEGGFPVVRYVIKWAPEQVRVQGKIFFTIYGHSII